MHARMSRAAAIRHFLVWRHVLQAAILKRIAILIPLDVASCAVEGR